MCWEEFSMFIKKLMELAYEGVKTVRRQSIFNFSRQDSRVYKPKNFNSATFKT